MQSFVQLNSPDLLALSECRLDSGISSVSFKLPGYIFHRLDHPPSRGLGIYVKDSLPLACKKLFLVLLGVLPSELVVFIGRRGI